jgi:hypothetical protein
MRDEGLSSIFLKIRIRGWGLPHCKTRFSPSQAQRRVDSRRHPGSLKGAFRRQTDGGAGSGACARDLSPRSRATSGPRPLALRPVWPTRESKKPRLERREASARRIWARNASLGVPACPYGTSRCGDPHRAPLGASPPHGLRGRKGMQSRVDPVAARPPERRSFGYLTEGAKRSWRDQPVQVRSR